MGIIYHLFLLLLCIKISESSDNSHLIKVTTSELINNDHEFPISSYSISLPQKNGHAKLSHMVANISGLPMRVYTFDRKVWTVDLTSNPIEPGSTVTLEKTIVFTHFELVPDQDVYLMPYSSIQYQAQMLNQGIPQKVKVPSERFKLESEDIDMVTIVQSTSTAIASGSIGRTKIRLVDKSLMSEEDSIQVESTIHIVYPRYMTMHVTPGDSWALQKFTDYTVEIRIFDAQQHQIYPSDNLDIQFSSSSEIVITNSTSNGTYHNIHTLSYGPAKLTARLQGTTSTAYSYGIQSQEIEQIQDLYIYEPLEIKPSAIVLPWLSDSKPNYHVSIYAAGGTGSYRWTSNSSSLTDINYNDEDSSVAEITTLGEGSVFIMCTDTKSPVFTRHSMIVISRIAELSILPSITETELGGDVLLPVAVYANISSLLKLHLPNEDLESDLVLFHDCSKIRFDVEVVEKARFAYEPAEIIPNIRPKSCMSLKFTCLQAGSSRVWISYSDPTDPSSKPIKTTTIIACHKPLRPVYPSEVGVLALHTSVELAFEGGPRPFGSRLDDHYAYLEPNNDPIVRFEPVVDRFRYNKDLHVFRAHCQEYGEVLLTLHVGNQPSITLPNPASSQTSIRIICSKPDSLELRLRLKETCPLNEMASLLDTIVPVSAVGPTDFEIVVHDDSKRPFMNISSLSINWTISGHGLTSSKQIEEVNAAEGYKRVTRNYVTIKPDGTEAQGKIQADLNHYKHQGLYRGKALELSTSLDIQFVDHAQVHPNKTILLYHPKNVAVLSIIRGSGYFSVESLQGTKHANVSYVPVYGQHRINITPLSIGKFTLRLEDQCIEGGPILSDVTIFSSPEFSREVLRPGRSLRYCQDTDPAIFCLYLSVDKVPSPPPPTTTTRAPIQANVALKTTVPPVHERTKPTAQAQTTVKPPTTQVPQQEPRTTPAPRVTFTDTPKPATIPSVSGSAGGILKLIMGYLIVFAVTLGAITLGYKWWQDQVKRRPNPQFITDTSSFLRQSPNASARFSPSVSRGPSSSTPRTRPLYTEKFSTTLFSD